MPSMWLTIGRRPQPAAHGVKLPRLAPLAPAQVGQEPIFPWEAKVYALA